MASITEIANEFFVACEAGKGWDGCRKFCSPQATFSAQVDGLSELKTLQQYAEWMKGLLTILEDGRYEVRSFATDPTRNNVCAYATFFGNAHRSGWSQATYREADAIRLRLRHGFRRRQDPSHDKDMERRLGQPGAWLVRHATVASGLPTRLRLCGGVRLTMTRS
jgi:hypothetical protein